MIKVVNIENTSDLEIAFDIRNKVFVEEQNVPREDEYDEFESFSKHYLAYNEEIPVGTCRWRATKNGIKMERFAVLKNYRGKKIGSALVEKALKDILQINGSDTLIYLHAQLTAMGLYEKFDFKTEGEMFTECDIQHYKMVFCRKNDIY